MPYRRPKRKEQVVWYIFILLTTLLVFYIYVDTSDSLVLSQYSHIANILVIIISWFFPFPGILFSVLVACGSIFKEVQITSGQHDLYEAGFHALFIIVTGVLVSLYSHQIRSHDKRLETILTHIKNGVICVHGPDAKITYANSVATRLFQTAESDLIGGSLYTFMNQRSSLSQFLQFCREGEGAAGYEMEIKGADIGKAWVSLTGFPEDADTILITITDINEQRIMEKSIQSGKIQQKTLLDAIPEVVWLADSDGLLRAVNHQCLKFAEKSEAELIGMPVEQLFGIGSMNHLNEGIREALTMQEIVRYDESMVKNGISSHYEITIIPIYNPEGETISIAGVFRDITHQKQFFSLIQEQEEMLRTVLDGLPVAALVIDADHTVRYVNLALSMLMERDVSYLIGTKQHPLLFYDDLSHPLLCDIMLEKEVDLALEKWHSGKYSPSPTVPGAFELFDTVSTPSSRDRWMRFTAVRLVDQAGRIIGAIETCEDFNNQKEAENAIRMSEERFKIASGIASDLIFEYSVLSGTMQWFGEVGERMGFECGESVSTLDDWYSYIHPDDRDSFETVVNDHLRTGKPVEHEIRILHQKRKHLTWRIKIAATYDLNSQHSKSVGIVTDITVIREIEDAKRTALIAVEENIEQFAILGDHIRNPLQAIAGYNDLQRGEYEDKISVQVRIINEIIDKLDEGWIRSESIREFLRRHYGLDRDDSKDLISYKYN